MHVECYRLDLLKGIPKGDWLCARCKVYNKSKEEIYCFLCPREKTLQQGAIIFLKETAQWVHITCVNQHDFISFKQITDPKTGENLHDHRYLEPNWSIERD